VTGATLGGGAPRGASRWGPTQKGAATTAWPCSAVVVAPWVRVGPGLGGLLACSCPGPGGPLGGALGASVAGGSGLAGFLVPWPWTAVVAAPFGGVLGSGWRPCWRARALFCFCEGRYKDGEAKSQNHGRGLNEKDQATPKLAARTRTGTGAARGGGLPCCRGCQNGNPLRQNTQAGTKPNTKARTATSKDTNTDKPGPNQQQGRHEPKATTTAPKEPPRNDRQPRGASGDGRVGLGVWHRHATC
jgi:hypothetical protein